MQNNAIIYLIGFLDLFGVSLVVPSLPSYVKTFGASPLLNGLIGSIYGLLQLLSSPIIGRWSDVIGRRYVLLASVFISLIGYFLLGLSNNLLLVLFSRVPCGIFKHTQNLCRAYLADITPKSRHAEVFGRLNSISVMGFIIGPIIGGYITKFGGFQASAILCAFIFFLNVVFIWIFLPELKLAKHTSQPVSSLTSFKAIYSDEIADDKTEKNMKQTSFLSLNWSQLWDVFLIKLLMALGMIMYRSNFLLSLEMRYNTDSVTNGYIISYSGLIGFISGWLAGPISNFYSDDRTLLIHLTSLEIITISAQIWTPSVLFIVILMTPMGLCNGLARVAVTTLMVDKGGQADTGSLMGISQSVISISRMLAPLVSGLVLELTLVGPEVLCSFLMAIALIIIIINKNKSPEVIKVT